MGWRDKASCIGMGDMFFPDETGGDGGRGMEWSALYRTCSDCPVMYECRLLGISENDGFFGNASPRERASVRAVFFPRKYAIWGDLDRAREWADDILESVDRGMSMLDALMRSGVSKAAISAFYARTTGDKFAQKKLDEFSKVKTVA